MRLGDRFCAILYHWLGTRYIYLCKQIAIRANTKEHWPKVLPGKTWIKHCCYSNHNISTVVCSTGSLRNMGTAITVCWGRQGLPELCKRGSDRERLLKERLNPSLLYQITFQHKYTIRLFYFESHKMTPQLHCVHHVFQNHQIFTTSSNVTQLIQFHTFCWWLSPLE